MGWSVVSKSLEAIKKIKWRSAVDALQHRETLAGERNRLSETLWNSAEANANPTVQFWVLWYLKKKSTCRLEKIQWHQDSQRANAHDIEQEAETIRFV